MWSVECGPWVRLTYYVLCTRSRFITLSHCTNHECPTGYDNASFDPHLSLPLAPRTRYSICQAERHQHFPPGPFLMSLG